MADDDSIIPDREYKRILEDIVKKEHRFSGVLIFNDRKSLREKVSYLEKENTDLIDLVKYAIQKAQDTGNWTNADCFNKKLEEITGK